MTQNVIESNSFGGRLKAVRTERKMSISRIARELDVDPRTVARWQSDDAMPSVTRLADLARVLNVPVSHLIDGLAA
jgi:transcriptional regulator with XRE-family HTH domain